MVRRTEGQASSAACAGKKEDHGASASHAACAARCIKGGSPAVLVSDGKVYKIANQDKVVEHAGHKVTIMGKMDADTITVESVKM